MEQEIIILTSRNCKEMALSDLATTVIFHFYILSILKRSFLDRVSIMVLSLLEMLKSVLRVIDKNYHYGNFALL